MTLTLRKQQAARRAVFLVVPFLVLFALYLYLPDFSNALKVQREQAGIALEDRNGRLLRLFPDNRGVMNLWVPLRRIPERVRSAFIAAEDQRFYRHFGFDPFAVCRAFFVNMRSGRIVSGASTMPQQAARLLNPRPRKFSSKFMEFLESVKMSAQLSKEEILELYLNLIPLGRNIRGIGGAATAYFDKDIEAVTMPEACVLAALPRSPSRLDPRKPSGREALLQARNRVIRRLADYGAISLQESATLLESPMMFAFTPFKLEAPHFTDYVRSRGGLTPPRVRTTLDLDLQKSVELILKAHQTRLSKLGATQAGAVALDVKDAHILAMVGSLQYGPAHDGFNNATLARRSAGSTLKPFLYSLLPTIKSGPLWRIPDTAATYRTPTGDYAPLNADRKAYGPVTVRSALGNSLNLSAIRVMNHVGVDAFYEFLRSLDLVDIDSPPPERLGLGLAVGNLDVSLLGLVQAYGALARCGLHRSAVYLDAQTDAPTRVMSAECAYIISHILADPSARLLTFGNPGYFDFGFPAAIKTGTSSNFRDSWTVAYTPLHVVGVWVGNFDGRPAKEALGAGTCGPIVKDIMARLYTSGPPPAFKRPKGVYEAKVCWLSGQPASPGCPYAAPELFLEDPATLPKCDMDHDGRPYISVGGAYADWVNTRRIQHGESRFRLMTEANGRQTTPRAASDPEHEGPRPKSGLPVSITSPHHGDRIVGTLFQAGPVRFRAVTHPPIPFLVWLVNGIEAARTPPPYDFYWTPVRGRHEVTAVTPNDEASQIVIEVE